MPSTLPAISALFDAIVPLEPTITLHHGGAIERHTVSTRTTPPCVCLWCTCGWFANIDAPDRDDIARVVAAAHIDGVRQRDAADRARWADVRRNGR